MGVEFTNFAEAVHEAGFDGDFIDFLGDAATAATGAVDDLGFAEADDGPAVGKEEVVVFAVGVVALAVAGVAGFVVVGFVDFDVDEEAADVVDVGDFAAVEVLAEPGPRVIALRSRPFIDHVNGTKSR